MEDRMRAAEKERERAEEEERVRVWEEEERVEQLQREQEAADQKVLEDGERRARERQERTAREMRERRARDAEEEASAEAEARERALAAEVQRMRRAEEQEALQTPPPQSRPSGLSCEVCGTHHGSEDELRDHLDSYLHYKQVQATTPTTPVTPDPTTPVSHDDEDPEFVGVTLNEIFGRAIAKKLTTPGAVESMKSNIADGAFSEEHYRKLWIGRITGKTPKKTVSLEANLPEWKCEKLLGEGGFGVVFMATSPEGRKAVVKSPIAASHHHETTHESAIMKVFERERLSGGLGCESVPSLMHATGTKMNMVLPLDISQTPMGAAYRRAQQSRIMMAMSYACLLYTSPSPRDS
eukprot:TRINITY_DN27798_c0_g1_i2.p1 TRINITY_DN27798_c0_g1~~TRINITY_DN27798_c0_g1_i2.p1  ORF type:complete len:353 (-),score=82.13 TRINITY_DN27798_c0_g1_i2:143-1201(-)